MILQMIKIKAGMYQIGNYKVIRQRTDYWWMFDNAEKWTGDQFNTLTDALLHIEGLQYEHIS